MTRFALPPLVFPDDVHPTAVRVELGLTLYLDDALYWAREGASRLLTSFVAAVPESSLAWFTTSSLGEWRRVGDAAGLRQVLDAFAAQAMPLVNRARHGFYFQIADDPGAPSCGFYYREVDPRRTERVSVIELTLPVNFDSGALFQLAMEAGGTGPLFSGVGGYAVRANWQTRKAAMTRAYKWCGRWWGIDIQDPDEMAWHVRDGLPGSNWLTLVGTSLVNRLGIPPHALEGWPTGVIAVRRPHATLLCAGDAPTEGDINALLFPEHYAEVARRIAPYFVPDPPELWGLFGGREHTRVWMRRFVEPDPWADREA